MAFLTAAQILGADDLITEVVSVPEWGGEVIVKTLPRVEKDAWQDSLSVLKGRKVVVNMANITARLLALCMVDENGVRLFSADQVEALGKKSTLACDRVFQVAARLNGLSKDDLDEMLTDPKNSGAAPAGGSS